MRAGQGLVFNPQVYEITSFLIYLPSPKLLGPGSKLIKLLIITLLEPNTNESQYYDQNNDNPDILIVDGKKHASG